MKKIFLLIGLCTVLAVSAQAQRNYSTALGLRLGYYPGITVKHFVGGNDAAIEGIIHRYWAWRGLRITGLYEWHKYPFHNDQFAVYFGLGAHIAYYDNRKNGHPWWNDSDVHVTAGIDGILGLEYTFTEVPINLSVDWKPYLTAGGNYYGLHGDGIALSVRYAF